MFTMVYIALALLPMLVTSLAVLITVSVVALTWAPLPTLAEELESDEIQATPAPSLAPIASVGVSLDWPLPPIKRPTTGRPAPATLYLRAPSPKRWPSRRRTPALPRAA